MSIGKDPHQTVVDQSSRLLDFLSAVAREVGPAQVRSARQHEFTIWPEEVPVHRAVALGATEDRAEWLRVRRIDPPPRVSVPAVLAKVIDLETTRTHHGTPRLRAHAIEAASLRAAEAELPRWRQDEASDELQRDASIARHREELETAFQSWLTSTWQPWIQTYGLAIEARELYARIYELHLRAEAEQDQFEVVWGHAVLVWDPPVGSKVIAPLLTAPVVINVDPDDGTMSVLPERPAELELDALEGIGLQGFDGLVALRERVRSQPIDPWTEEDRLELRRQIIAPLGVDALLEGSSRTTGRGDAIVLNDGWVIMMRKRPMRQERFYDELAETLRELDRVPDALAAVVADRDLVDAALISRGDTPLGDDGTSDRLLMPLPVNDDQERIARQLAVSRGVTVQGPPGTGKSHTIVNLVSHLVAQGKRVLVTAQNDQALSVLRDKIPAELRDLSIAVLGSTPAAMEELRSSAQSMQDSLSSLDPVRNQARIADLGERIDQLREVIRRTDLALIEALRSETREYTLPVGSRRAPEVAKWVVENRAFDAIPDGVPAGSTAPLTSEELAELASLARSISPADGEATRKDLPAESWIPGAAELERLFQTVDRQQTEATSLEEQGLILEAVGKLDRAKLSALARTITQEAIALRGVSGPWENRFGAAVHRRDPQAAFVMERSAAIRERIAHVAASTRALAGHLVEVPPGNPNVQLPLLHQWRDRLASGKKLPAFGWREVKDLDRDTRFDGYPVTTADQVQLVIVEVSRRVRAGELQRLALESFTPLGVPIPEIGPGSHLQIEALAQRVEAVHKWWSESFLVVHRALAGLIEFPGATSTPEGLEKSQRLLEAAVVRIEEREISRGLEELANQLSERSSRPNTSPLWADLSAALLARSVGQWDEIQRERDRLLAQRSALARRQELSARLTGGGAPAWCHSIVQSGGDLGTLESSDLEVAWAVSAARTWLSQLHAEADVAILMARAHEQATELRRLIVEVANLSARTRLKLNTKDRHRRALETWLGAIKKVGKGTGKNAPRFQAQARSALPQAMGSVPIWIMPIYRVLENFDPRESEPFDVVIVDESSQCDLLSLGVLALGKKTVVVGDDKQTSPMAVGIRTERIFDLQGQFVDDLPDKTLLTMDESLYSISSRAFPSTILLREHFRCVPEIIGFSNRFYDGKVLPLREVTVPQIGDPLRAVFVRDGASVKRGTSRVNRREAEVLVDQVAACAADPSYDGLTFGVVTLMSGPQSQIIESLLVERLGAVEFERRRLRVGNPPVFQGDERHVIFVSVVADDNTYAWTRPNHAQWANVAVSRAQDQLWVFYTVDPTTLGPNDLRRHLIEYVQDGGCRQDATDLFDLTESKFERDVLQQMLDRDYHVTPQHKVGSFRIDFVVTVGDGERLAIECDGDSFHGPDKWDEDVRRQRVLERLGWNFWRVRASEFYLDPVASMQPLWDRLEEMKQRVIERAEQRRKALERQAIAAEEAAAAAAAKVEVEEATKVEESAEGSVGLGEVGVEWELPAPPTSKPRQDLGGSWPDGAQFSGLDLESSLPHLDLQPGEDGTLTDVPPSAIRKWARANGIYVGERGRIAPEVREAFLHAYSIDSASEPEPDPKTGDHSQPERAVASNEPADVPALRPVAQDLQPSPSLVADVWRNGQAYVLDQADEVRPRGGGQDLSSIIGSAAALPVIAAMRRARPEGGRFKIDESRALVTVVEGEPTFVTWVSEDAWFPQELAN